MATCKFSFFFNLVEKNSFFFNLVEKTSFTVVKKFLSVAKMAQIVYEREMRGAVHYTAEEFENEGFTLKTNQMFSVTLHRGGI